ncbi:MAG: DUF58 domain-containing protein [Actinomycetales bacterium]|nr:MAG: DUF58 domain-containing protein [Actinomycetales bacterium]
MLFPSLARQDGLLFRARELRRKLSARVLASPVGALTSVGWTVLVGGIAAAIVGWSFGWAEFRVVAVTALVSVALAIPFVLRQSDYVGELTLHKQRVAIGELGMGRATVKPRAGGRVGGRTVELPVGRAVARFLVPGLTGDEEHEELFSVPSKRRAVIPVGPVMAVQTDPVGFFRREKRLTQTMELFIHPQLVGVESGAVGFLKDVEGVTTSNLSSSDVSFHALRDYVPGDDRRAVHWRTTARTGKLVVRQFEETMRAHLLLLLSLNPGDYRKAEDFELAVSVVGSIGVAAFREERRVTVHTTTGPMLFPSMVGMLDELSRLELVEGEQLRAATARAIRDCPEASVCALVTGGESSVTDLRTAEQAIPLDLARFAVRAADTIAIGRRTVGRLTLIDLARLGDLGYALRSVR